MDTRAVSSAPPVTCSSNVGEGEKAGPVDNPPGSARTSEQSAAKAQNGGSQNQTVVSTAPLDMPIEFVSSLMSRNYENALLLCKRIMEYEPHNRIAAEFYPVLLKKNIEAIEKGSEKSSDSEDGESSDASSDETSTCSCRTGSTCSRCDDSGEDSDSDESLSDSDSDQDENNSKNEKGDISGKVEIIRTRL